MLSAERIFAFPAHIEALSINHQGQFRGDDLVNLASNAPGQRDYCHRQGAEGYAHAASLQADFRARRHRSKIRCRTRPC